jgi:hypothetical protein
MKRSTRIKRVLGSGILPGLLSWCVVGCSISAGAQPYVEILAEIELTAYSGYGTKGAENAEPRTISLTCVTGTTEWRIENDYIRGGDSAWHFDGTNVYHRLRSVGSPQGTINIWPSRDGHPLGSVAQNIPWLAFCSGPYLKREGRIVPLPCDDLRHTRDRYGYRDKTTTFADDLGLPRTVDLFTSKALFLASESEFDKESSFGDRNTEGIKRRAAELAEGVLTFHYEVTESTNFLGQSFPTQFEFFQQGRMYEPNGDWYWRGVGRVKSVRPADRPNGLFDPTAKQTLVDWRFPDAVIYQSTNNGVAPTNDPGLQQILAVRTEELRNARKPQSEVQPPR